jgi:hypothetical protein
MERGRGSVGGGGGGRRDGRFCSLCKGVQQQEKVRRYCGPGMQFWTNGGATAVSNCQWLIGQRGQGESNLYIL